MQRRTSFRYAASQELRGDRRSRDKGTRALWKGKVEDSIGDGDEQVGNSEVRLGENCFAGSARTVGATFGAD